jgi:hypothetical protein
MYVFQESTYEVKVQGFRNRETGQGEMKFPILSNRPSQGTGRINPGGTLGVCKLELFS